jgi:hypothetical protein
MNTFKSSEHPATTVEPSEAASSASRPEFFRLPKSGGDPYFGFTRSFYYEGEARGYWKLARIRERGKTSRRDARPVRRGFSFCAPTDGGG